MAAEKLGVETRAGYYEQAGVIRDMFQNHMLQLLSLIAMESPSQFEADCVRDEKAKVFRALRQFTDKPGADLILGQYGPGSIDGQPVPGYRQEKGVAGNSLTATFAMMRLFVDNWRWQGVPFYLVSGKRMARKETKIVIQFKKVPHTMFQDVFDKTITANRLSLGIYPKEEIKLTFQTKNPGPKICLSPMTMDFKYEENYPGASLGAYEKVLLDCILGDQMLFWRRDGVDLSWSLITPILNDCETCPGREQLLHLYEAGGWGPDEAKKWLERLVIL
jgi:glucose-6-phosphate 1-dehydrogenase